MTGIAAIDDVLQLFDGVGDAVFTADYTAVLAFDGTTTDVTVTQDGAESASIRRSVTIGDVRYITASGTTSTCAVAEAQCTPRIDAARVSNTGVTPNFTFGDVAKRLRRDAMSLIGEAVASTSELGGATATCVDVPLGNGTSQYCAFADGALARFVGGDVTIDVVSYDSSVDESLFVV